MNNFTKLLVLGIVSGVAVWSITRFLEEFETVAEEDELHTKVSAKAVRIIKDKRNKFSAIVGGNA